MREETRTVLEEIGYSKALRLDRSLTFHFWDPERPSTIWADKNEARKGRMAIQAIFTSLHEAPERLIDLIDGHSRTSEDWDQERSPFNDTLRAILSIQAMSDKEIAELWGNLSTKGPSVQYRANEVAKIVAKIFVLGTGEMPTCGADSEGNPSGKYANVLHTVFRYSKYKDAFRKPGDKAIKWLKENDKAEFKSLMSLRARKGRRVSLVKGSFRNF